MKFIVKIHPEIFVKSSSVRKRFVKILTCNIRIIVQRQTEYVKVFNCRDHIEVTLKSNFDFEEVLNILKNTPGIHHILQVQQSYFTDMHDISTQVLKLHRSNMENKTFSVRVKRHGKHEFTSVELERYIGCFLNESIQSASVRLVKPDLTISIEIFNNKLNQIITRIRGLGGFPLGTQEDVLSLISGGFDSAVSSYLHIKRGSKTHYCFFNLDGSIHEIMVRKISYFLWKKYGSSAKVNFFSVNFVPVVTEILKKIDNSYMSVILKRMFIRAGAILAERYGIQALITGESLGQVSSQTLTNLRCIDSVTDTLILRPLINWDKEDIIKLARDIGTEVFSKSVPEFCGVISKKPTVKAIKKKVEIEESKFDFSILEQVTLDVQVTNIRNIISKNFQVFPRINQVKVAEIDSIILDIRSPDDKSKKPLVMDNVEVRHMPFFRLINQFKNLDQDKVYLLYCEHGIMSLYQAINLQNCGFNNVKIYRP
ncbi:tRNA uracil 4-sulfurtransferase ThiI [Candidatus Photodesmus anomalopis]|uniref:tRNA sulfurtransferase n=1 Tax=Candidatus Photodesmus katoptron Akat1 TaxID=1236703 RepID=S3DJP9_9GAMM|nr:tRNA uracil 4-sulfurtransferase ThiI [Candidatus Photodesmus katoptron]EPE37369.1 thiamine biosynthesis/tRNA modification protein ThiI [Candidatus Photodesmus katoptron Akat1]